jgi:hypothetical protein
MAGKKGEIDMVKAKARNYGGAIYSSDLIECPLKFNEPGHDKVYIAGWVSFVDGYWIIEIRKHIPKAVVFRQKVNEELNVNCPTVEQVRKKHFEVGEISLISAGSFIWVVEKGVAKLFLLQRDLSAETDVGLLTGPAGRCDRKVSETITKETNEEFLIVVKTEQNGVEIYRLLCFYRQEKDKKVMAKLKLRQKEAKQKFLTEQGRLAEARILEQIKSVQDIDFINIEALKVGVDKWHRIVTFVDDKKVDEVISSIAFFDRVNNTLEIRDVLKLSPTDEWEVALIIDGESFNREVLSFNSLDEVPRHLAVPTLKHYLDNHSIPIEIPGGKHSSLNCDK